MKKAFLCLLFLAGTGAVFGKSHEVKSPNGKITVSVNTEGETVTYEIRHEDKTLIAPSPISMTLDDGTVLGAQPTERKASLQSVDQTIRPPFYKKAEIVDRYNELTITFRGDYGLRFRVYDDGAAYRFFTTQKDSITVRAEQADLHFATDGKAYLPYVKGEPRKSLDDDLFSSFENTYVIKPVSQVGNTKLVFLPVLIDAGDGIKMVFTEADLEDYPGMRLYNRKGDLTLNGYFAACPDRVEQGGHNMLQGLVRTRHPYLARTAGSRAFPWRVFAITDRDVELANNDLVYRLASPSRVEDTSWIKPGKVAWDWWNDWNLDGVDFRAGINNDTYKYYIDFAAEHGIEYVILDEGWAVNKQADLFQVIPEIDLEELVEYGRTRKVGIVLWAGYYAMARDMERVCQHYSKMGIKGFKVDFMDRDDQQMVNFYYRLAETAARYHLFIDYHGAYKPTGLHRTYPNVLNFEGVFGLEQLKWSKGNVDMVTYDVTMPYIRMLAGPIDYTQGAMRNATRKNYRPVNSEAMSQGTRCRQLAEYVVFESPFNMLCDTPSNYMREQECTQFISAVPTVWDETVGVDGRVGEYLILARRKGDVWYIGGMTNWDARTVELDLGFLGEGVFEAELFRDGINADRAARDYKREQVAVPADRKLSVKMAPGGGFAMRIIRK